nr:dihydroneopterin aldolase [uncultured Bacteroides sp.]
MTSYILLENIRFFAYHGVAPQETTVGNEFIVSLRLKTDITRAIESDDVADTVNYAEIHQAVKEEMDIPSKLLEHVAGRIVLRLFNDFPTVECIDLKLSKRNPPMGADIETAGVEVHVERQTLQA